MPRPSRPTRGRIPRATETQDGTFLTRKPPPRPREALPPVPAQEKAPEAKEEEE